MKNLIRLLLIAGLAQVCFNLPRLSAEDWPQWRGPHRNGISQERGLLPSWPDSGPPMLWKVNNLGTGYAAPAIVGQVIYVLGNEGLDQEFVQALKVGNGSRIWLAHLGKVGNPEQKPNYPGARSTPTIDGDFLYALGSDGDLVCVQISDGTVKWRRNLRTEFGGKPGTWAYSESPLVESDRVICTPGGSDATILAFDKRTGDVAWKCPLPEADEAGYASAIMVDAGGVRQIVQLLQKGLVGVEAQTGRFLWRFGRAVSKYGANIPTPLVGGEVIYCAAAGTGGGAIRLAAGQNTVEARELYWGSKLPTAIGGALKIGNELYGTTSSAMLCVNFETGDIHWEERALGAASLVFADDRIYLHGENGEVALIEPSTSGYLEKGRFSPPGRPERANQMEKSWAYPAIANGRLYLRDHGTLWCYDLRANR